MNKITKSIWLIWIIVLIVVFMLDKLSFEMTVLNCLLAIGNMVLWTEVKK